MERQLTTVERSRFRTLEKIIDEGLETYVRVGVALAEVKSAKLYRDDYGTWESYVRQRWNFSKRHADNLISASEVTQRLIENGNNCSQKLPATESQARELAKAPPEAQAEIWEDVLDEHEEPTAKDVKRAVEAHREPVQGEIVHDTEDVSIVRDELEREVPARLRPAHAVSAKLSAIGRQVDAVKREAVALAGDPGGRFLSTSIITVLAKDLKGEITNAGYWTACPRCDGRGCNRCNATGFLPRSMKQKLSAQDRAKIEATAGGAISAPDDEGPLDPVEVRARASVAERLRGLRLDLGNLGLGGKFDAYLDEIERAARGA